MTGIELGLLIASMVGQGASAAAGSASRRGDRESQEALTREQIAANERGDVRDVASKESLLDPFRHQLNQASAINSLDKMERSTYTPTKLTADPNYAASVPQISGGFNYTRSPEARASAGALKQNVMSGEPAPSMTDPLNYGRTGTLNLLKILAENLDPNDPRVQTLMDRLPGRGAGAAGVQVGTRPRNGAPIEGYARPRRYGWEDPSSAF